MHTNVYVCTSLVSLTSSPEKPPLQSPMDDKYCIICGVVGL